MKGLFIYYFYLSKNLRNAVVNILHKNTQYCGVFRIKTLHNDAQHCRMPHLPPLFVGQVLSLDIWEQHSLGPEYAKTNENKKPSSWSREKYATVKDESAEDWWTPLRAYIGNGVWGCGHMWQCGSIGNYDGERARRSDLIKAKALTFGQRFIGIQK